MFSLSRDPLSSMESTMSDGNSINIFGGGVMLAGRRNRHQRSRRTCLQQTAALGTKKHGQEEGEEIKEG